jgi:hypothetical protein
VLDEPIPMSIEPLEDVTNPGTKPRVSPSPNTVRERSPGASARPPKASRSGNSADDKPAANNRSRPTPRLLPGMLGRFFQPPPAASRNRVEPKGSGERARSESEAQTEPDTDASVQRKIEKQIREALGDRVRAVEVRVSGRNVLIVGQATRFWQKRMVRRTLETLPVLQGYRARIDLED